MPVLIDVAHFSQLYRLAEQDLDVECRRAGPFIEWESRCLLLL